MEEKYYCIRIKNNEDPEENTKKKNVIDRGIISHFILLLINCTLYCCKQNHHNMEEKRQTPLCPRQCIGSQKWLEGRRLGRPKKTTSL